MVERSLQELPLAQGLLSGCPSSQPQSRRSALRCMELAVRAHLRHGNIRHKDKESQIAAVNQGLCVNACVVCA
jgi:hypothetical protein